MQNRTPVARSARAPIPEFEPVPRKYRHDGWTPERQRAFIEALADTGCVSRAAAMVNMSQSNCYVLRRAPGAEGLRRAWDIALDFGLKRMKDFAFQRAMEGELVPVFHAGKLQGFRRKRNDALLMFCLRHYDKDASGRRTTVNYFRTEAAVGSGAGSGEGGKAAASATTMRVTSGERADPETLALRDDQLANELQRFEGVRLDATAQAAIAKALEECAARERAMATACEKGGDAAADVLADDPREDFVAVGEGMSRYRGTLESGVALEREVEFVPGEASWRLVGAQVPEWVPADADGLVPLPAPADARAADDGVTEVKRRPSRRGKREVSSSS